MKIYHILLYHYSKKKKNLLCKIMKNHLMWMLWRSLQTTTVSELNCFLSKKIRTASSFSSNNKWYSWSWKMAQVNEQYINRVFVSHEKFASHLQLLLGSSFPGTAVSPVFYATRRDWRSSRCVFDVFRKFSFPRNELQPGSVVARSN